MGLFGNKLWAVGSGKGGVGKSFLTAWLAAALARMGKTVVAVDAGFGSPDLHVFLGIRNVGMSLLDTITNRLPAGHALRKTRLPRLRMLACTGDAPGTADLPAETRKELIERIRSLNADHVLLDLASGASAQTLDFFDAADIGVVVSTPDPASICRTFSFLRHALERRRARAPAGPRAVAAHDPWLVWNMAAAENDRRLAGILQAAARQHLGIELALAGTIAADDAVHDIVRTMAFPDLPASAGAVANRIEEAARRILDGGGTPRRPPASEPANGRVSPAPGLNDNVELFGRRVHVQTEDMGPQRRLIATHVFLDGRVIHSKQSAYPQDAAAAPSPLIAEMMRAQHRDVIREIENRPEGIAQP